MKYNFFQYPSSSEMEQIAEKVMGKTNEVLGQKTLSLTHKIQTGSGAYPAPQQGVKLTIPVVLKLGMHGAITCTPPRVMGWFLVKPRVGFALHVNIFVSRCLGFHSWSLLCGISFGDQAMSNVKGSVTFRQLPSSGLMIFGGVLASLIWLSHQTVLDVKT